MTLWLITVEHPDGVAGAFVTNREPSKVLKPLLAKYEAKLNGRDYMIKVHDTSLIDPAKLAAILEKNFKGLLA